MRTNSILIAVVSAFLGSLVLITPQAGAKDVSCQMVRINLLCRLEPKGDMSLVNCFKNGSPTFSFQCRQTGTGWDCKEKEGRGEPLQRFGHSEFQNDVTRCDRLCEFCVNDWQPVSDQKSTEDQKNKCRKIRNCVEEDNVQVVKYKRKCSTSSFSAVQRCEDEPVYETEKRCIRYEEVEQCN